LAYEQHPFNYVYDGKTGLTKEKKVVKKVVKSKVVAVVVKNATVLKNTTDPASNPADQK